MARLMRLEKDLGKLFNAPAPKKRDTQRRQREEAKKLAAAHGIEIEKFSEGGMNVWPPRALDEALDPYAGDHYADFAVLGARASSSWCGAVAGGLALDAGHCARRLAGCGRS